MKPFKPTDDPFEDAMEQDAATNGVGFCSEIATKSPQPKNNFADGVKPRAVAPANLERIGSVKAR